MSRILLTLALALIATQAHACGGYNVFNDDAPESVEQAEAYITAHREQGSAGLEKALKQFQHACRGQKGRSEQAVERWHAALDRIAAQRGAAVSKLYWYTDLEAAQTAAKESGKPILSLRMLGKLTDEYSCANSRFFRTTLYSNEAISTVLRERFILHWKTVRPVPKVTIDFGDGRKLERTITGNSAHYVLTPAGKPLDVLPGLYSPKAFVEWLDRVEELSYNYPNMRRPEPERTLAAYHQQREQAILTAWQQDLSKLNSGSPATGFSMQPNPRQANSLPTAAQAAPVARGKFAVEAPLLKVVANQHAAPGKSSTPPPALAAADRALAKGRAEVPMLQRLAPLAQRLEQRTADPHWQEIAALHREETKLDKSSVAIIRKEHENAEQAMRRALSKRFIEDPILALVQKFETDIALDTVKNEYQLHRQIHRWFAEGTVPQDFDQLNEKVYAELFLTPSSDPWLGLAPADVYTALEGAGKVAQPSRLNRSEVALKLKSSKVVKSAKWND
ncbi:thioredoxin domain-containing protein [Adhaeretor mobilis]|uniref:Uncharacterized protein n=1 Tax=Adhaeretor mobilis TaxID=1930276 RepID=A0A517N0V3_9BACT|nr:hypothetical protein [Adhaeretor mobilis]QDT00648.1 hypothetical protein HG15A2_39870 [Adhaeretor mobilis]